VPLEDCDSEPLTHLLRALDGRASICADDLTFPTAAVMAEWLWGVLLGSRDQKQTDALVGYAVHFLQDCCVPHHALGALLLGHAEFEAMLGETWIWWVNDGTADALIDKACAQKLDREKSIRTLCEEAARVSLVSASRARLYQAVWRGGWVSYAQASIRRAIEATAMALRKANPALG
jgi:hypothetical protein